MDPNMFAIYATLDGCAGWIAGLVLLVVGFVTVRKAVPNAGYMVGAAGALQLISSCCGNWQSPAAVWLDLYRMTEMFGVITSVLAFLAYLAMAGLLIGAAVMLAKAVPAQSGGAS